MEPNFLKSPRLKKFLNLPREIRDAILIKKLELFEFLESTGNKKLEIMLGVEKRPPKN
jgi:hypothetical protein